MTKAAADERSPELADRRRAEIVQEARRLFGERGTTEVPMEEIASAAGVVRSTVYVYFSSRAELLAACISSMYDQIASSIGPIDISTPPAALEGIIAALMGAIDEHPAFFRLMLATQGSPNAAGQAVSAQLGGIGSDVGSAIAGILLEGNASGSWSVDDPKRSSDLIGQQIYGALSVRAEGLDQTPPNLAAKELVGFLMHGLRGESDH